MTYVGDLITEVRSDTENVEFGAGEGIDTDDFLRYMNYALRRLQSLLIQNNATVFERTVDIATQANVAAYTIPDNVYLKEKVKDVQFSDNGSAGTFREIREIADSYREYGEGARVAAYTRRGGEIILAGVPKDANGVLRVTYNRQVDRLDIRRGQIDTITVATGAITSDTIALLDNSFEDDTRITGVNDLYLNIVSKNGEFRAKNVPYTIYSPFTFTHLAHTLTQAVDPAAGDFITIGKDSTTHLLELDSPDVERYLQLYCAVKIFRRDSSSDSKEAARELAAVETDIIEAYRMEGDEVEVQIDDRDIMSLGLYR